MLKTKCECTTIHKDIIIMVRKLMPSQTESFSLAEFFKVLGDATRISILFALSRSEMCVCDLSSLLNMTQSAVSHQLRILKQARLVKYRKEGKIAYYSLDDEHVRDVLHLGSKHINEVPEKIQDQISL